MKLIRILAVLSSILLAAGYIYVSAASSQDQGSSGQDDVIMSSSKSRVLLDSGLSPPDDIVIPGTKSAPIFVPEAKVVPESKSLGNSDSEEPLEWLQSSSKSVVIPHTINTKALEIGESKQAENLLDELTRQN